MNVYHQWGNNLGGKDPKSKWINVHFENDAENKQIIYWTWKGPAQHVVVYLRGWWVQGQSELFNSFCLLTQCKGKDRTAFSATEVTSAWERSERILCRKVRIEKKDKKVVLACKWWESFERYFTSPTLGGWWGGREAHLPMPGFVLLAIPRQSGQMPSQSVRVCSPHLIKSKSRLLL